MTNTEKRALVRRYFHELWNKGNLVVADEIIAADFGSMRGRMPGREAVKLYINSYRAAYPLTRFTILSMVVQGDMVTVCWASQGTHRSNCSSSCGNRPAVTGTSVYRISGGKIADSWIESENVGVFQRSSAEPVLN